MEIIINESFNQTVNRHYAHLEKKYFVEFLTLTTTMSLYRYVLSINWKRCVDKHNNFCVLSELSLFM